jgi:hypothetical protein
MNETQQKPNNLIDTTDCLEAVGVFRGWKNFLFVIVILCLLLLQASFWLVNLGYVKTDQQCTSTSAAVEAQKEGQIAEAAKQTEGKKQQIEEAAKQVASESGEPAQAAEEPKKGIAVFDIKFGHLAWLIRFLNFALVLAAILYCLTMLFSLKVSLLGRLGGINHISRAFFLSLVFVVLLLPWQRFFGGVVSGAMYSPGELLKSCEAAQSRGIFCTIFYYLRFTGYWVLVMLFLIFAHMRSTRWARAILRRLEVI